MKRYFSSLLVLNILLFFLSNFSVLAMRETREQKIQDLVDKCADCCVIKVSEKLKSPCKECYQGCCLCLCWGSILAGIGCILPPSLLALACGKCLLFCDKVLNDKMQRKKKLK